MHTIVRFEGSNSFAMCCDFCAIGGFEKDVVLIASPNGTHICQNCVADCSVIIDEGGIERHLEKHESLKPTGERQ